MKATLFAESPPRILIVDDDPVIRILLRQFLEGEGYLVDEEENGYAALERLGEQSYDLVILDIAMPGIDGPTVCENITTSLVEPPPVLMVTAIDDEKTVDRSFGAGAVDFIRKPIRWPVLKNRIRYILGSHRSREKMRRLSKNYEMILDAAANGICGVNLQGEISYINPAGQEMLGYSEEEMTGHHYLEFFQLSTPDHDDFEVDCCPFFQEQAKLEPIHFDDARLLHRDGTSFPVDFSATPILQRQKISGGVLVFQDITERQEAAELIRYMANHDTLTQLPNRNYFRRRLPQAISLARRYARKLCLLFIDLDRFKPINDTYGHGIGDQVLVQVAQRLRTTLRASDSVCRLGGDEFVILLESTETAEGASHVAQKAIDLLNQAIEVENHICYIGASVGISVFPDDCTDAETMLRHADIAMYQAKKNGRNCWNFYCEQSAL
ncbi:GGDEF domain-containing response regulator [Desulfogranum mediterraneum]|uniref:GGDEF domain-containing response regulator n=1 Tax=Desulfogranum mediterraneum TaxID=160661 RepID=UPI00040B4C25|nr:diguanylate cyclase [Desulfogranum mediterraneum]